MAQLVDAGSIHKYDDGEYATYPTRALTFVLP